MRVAICFIKSNVKFVEDCFIDNRRNLLSLIIKHSFSFSVKLPHTLAIPFEFIILSLLPK